MRTVVVFGAGNIGLSFVAQIFSRAGYRVVLADIDHAVLERIEREGDAWFSYTVLRGRTALRVNVENRRMRRENVERLVRVIRATADRILAEPGPLMT